VTALVALIGASIGAYAGYRNGDKAVLASASAVPIGELQGPSGSEADRLKYRQLENIVEEVAIAAGLPIPKLFVIPDPDPNAFATGRDPEHASIAVTKGLLDMLNREELQGVVAHELSHVRNFDIRLMTVVAALVGAVVLLSDFVRRWLFWGGGRRGGSSRDKGGGGIAGAVLMVVWLITIILSPVIGQLLSMMVSRRREYLADASGAELTRNPLALASALQRIESAVEPTKSIRRGTANLCIADPLGREVGTHEGGWSDLFASHPPMVKRISALREMAYER
jgi:heat shock protein HtpX